MIYKWKPGRQIKADPTLAAEVLNELAEQNRLDADNVVEVSKPEDAVLHNDFEWDDSKAALEYRKHQARNIINALLVVEEEQPQIPPIRCFFKLEETTSNYTPIKAIYQSADSMEALIKKALNELIAFRMKYESIVRHCKAEKEFEALKGKLETEGA